MSTPPISVRCALVGMTVGALLTSTLSSQAVAAPTPTPAAPVAAPSSSIYTPEEKAALSLARETQRGVPVDSNTSETSMVVANPNGTFSLSSSREAVRTKTSTGAWTAIDTQLKATSDGRLRPAATALDMTLSDGGTGPAIIIHRGQTTSELSFPFALPTPSLNGATATYSDVLPGVDLQLTANAEHVAEVLVIKNATAAQNPQLAQLQLLINTTGGSLSVAPDGSSTILDTTGATVFQAAAPSMWDSRPSIDGTPNAHSSGVGDRLVPVTATANTARRNSVGASANSRTLTLAPDTATLTGPDVTYPIYLDPSWGIGRNHFLVVRTSGANYWTNTDYLRVGYCAWAGCTPYAKARSYFDFSYPLNPRQGQVAVISSASVTVPGRSTASSYATPVTLSRSGAISSGQVWGGPLSTAIESVNTTATSTTAQFADGNVVAYVQQASHDGWNSITFALTSPDEANKDQWKTFGNNPTLNVTYTYPPITPFSLAAGPGLDCNGTHWVNSSSVALTAHVDDNYNGTGSWEDWNIYKVGSGTLVATGQSVTPNGVYIASKTFTLGEGAYYFQTRTTIIPADSVAVSSVWVQSGNFTVQTIAPAAASIYSADFPQVVPASIPFGVTDSEARTKGTTFTAFTTDPGTVAFAYGWDTTTTPSPTQCQPAAARTTPQSIGYVTATNMAGSIPYPTDLTSPSTLYVTAISASGNKSATTAYVISPWIGTSTSLIEATPSLLTTSIPTSTITNNPNQLSAGSEVRLSATGPGQTASQTVTVTNDGTYYLTLEFGTGPDHAKVSITTTGGTCTSNGAEVVALDLYSSTSGKIAARYTNDDAGWTCPAGGTITYTITVTDKNVTSTGYVVDYDYVRLLLGE